MSTAEYLRNPPSFAEWVAAFDPSLLDEEERTRLSGAARQLVLNPTLTRIFAEQEAATIAAMIDCPTDEETLEQKRLLRAMREFRRRTVALAQTAGFEAKRDTQRAYARI